MASGVLVSFDSDRITKVIAKVNEAKNKIKKDYGGGDVYYGQMEGGLRHGYGTQTFRQGENYVGEFKNNTIHGHGTYTNADGTIWHSGEWINDKPKK